MRTLAEVDQKLIIATCVRVAHLSQTKQQTLAPIVKDFFFFFKYLVFMVGKAIKVDSKLCNALLVLCMELFWFTQATYAFLSSQ